MKERIIEKTRSKYRLWYIILCDIALWLGQYHDIALWSISNVNQSQQHDKVITEANKCTQVAVHAYAQLKKGST